MTHAAHHEPSRQAGQTFFRRAMTGTPYMRRLRRQLSERMAARGWSANALAKRAGTHANAAKDILAGRIENPRMDTVAKLADALDCTIADLVEEEVKLDAARLAHCMNRLVADGVPPDQWAEYLPILYRHKI